ncbi:MULTISPECIES: thiol reductant ABC exporter subunit CydD [Gammaproteobacteria]|uniref:thiol reductant ABC exporter subunit CydD n=1 Tax=Gammaproteobacteria TaxID=1236 RepID=UPI000DD08FD1|nr:MULTISPECIES: thiol reductant ABC exporter subunit CydD [Gammaproteobacteria]RTE87340.1 thiol reductant ABC exporter subunit CydD [Aliidiomarina sp. B3213]TCZ92874.1 thiol reductant ABC exporter subunit CydD [Lysobacter sp. N42]
MSEQEKARQLLARLHRSFSKTSTILTLLVVSKQLTRVVWIGLLAYILATVIGSDHDLMPWSAITLWLFVTLLSYLISIWEVRWSSVLRYKMRSATNNAVINYWQANAGQQIDFSESNLLIEPVAAMESYFLKYLPQRYVSVVIPLAVISVVFYLDWIAGLFLLFSAPLIPLFMALVGMGAEKLNQKHFQTLRRVSSIFIDRVRNITTLRLFNRSDWAEQEIHRASERYRMINMRTLKVAFLSSAVLEFFTAVAIAAVAIYVGFALLGFHSIGPASEMTWFSGLLLLMLAPEFFQPIREFANYYHDRAKALGAAADLITRVDFEPSTTAGERENFVVHAIRVEKLELGYNGENLALSPISFDVNKGGCVVITGPTGVGKSTLLKTIAGLQPERAGNVRIEPETFEQAAINYLPQMPAVIQGSLRENFKLAAPNCTDEEIIFCLQQAGLGSLFNELPNGLETYLGPDGFGLSGGELKRLAVARALISSSNVVVWDEPTASLDRHHAAQVINLIQQLKQQGYVMIIASHDADVLAVCDKEIAICGTALESVNV